MRLAAFAILAAVGLALVLPGGPPDASRSCKPEAPLDLSARLEGDPRTGFTVVAEASCRIDAELELEVVYPAGVTPLEGRIRETGRRAALRPRARAGAGTAGPVFVRAAVEAGGARLAKVVALDLLPAPARRYGAVRVNGRGERIRVLAP